jgi:hypothetical protein
MMRTALSIAFLVLPMTAQAYEAIGNDSGCDRVMGREERSDNLFVLWPDRIERWESNCAIVGLEGDLNTRSIIHTSCEGEGETWQQSYGMTPVGDDLFTIWPIESPEIIFELRQCK